MNDQQQRRGPGGRIIKSAFFQLASWLAYGLLASLYERVATIFSNGEWGRWRRQAIVELHEQTARAGRARPRILEVGCGTGALLAELSDAGSVVMGLDRSPQMLQAAARRLRGARLARVIPVQGMAQATPLPAGSVDGIVLTFPTAYIFDRRTWQEFGRLLAPDGCVIWVDSGQVYRPNLVARLLQAVLAPDPATERLMLAMPARLRDLGFAADWQTRELGSSRISVLIAHRAAA